MYKEMDEQKTKEAKLYKSLDKLEALIQHNESPLDTWAENEFELNKTYAFDEVAFSSWLTDNHPLIPGLKTSLSLIKLMLLMRWRFHPGSRICEGLF